LRKFTFTGLQSLSSTLGGISRSFQVNGRRTAL
jgi:hypothetical protein